MTQHPPGPKAVDAKFLTTALRAAGHDVTVAGFTTEPVGTGQIGQCIRYRLDLDGADQTCPATLVGKFASDDPASRQTGVALRNYLKEVRFYQELAARVSVRTPRCYHAAIEGEGPDFALLLEDLDPARQGDQIEGCTVAEAEAALGEIVGLHASTWNDDDLDDFAWLGPRPTPAGDEAPPDAAALYAMLLGSFFDRFGPRLAPEEAAIIERVASSTGPPWQYPDRPRSLIHVDYRLDNVLFDHRREPPVVTVVDWQSVTMGNPVADVAYFIGAGLRPELRGPSERGLVAGYHRALEQAGVVDYPWDACWDDYRRGSFHGFAITVIASTIVEETERGNDMFTVMARRHARHALDLGADEFL
ncbi:MAG: aminoglycoside phosphotransferase family protein [Actinomycetota bacterium]